MIAQFFTGLEVVIPLVLLALIAFAIVALVTARRDPDPAGTRPYAIYLVLVIFLALFTALFALTSMASNIARIPVAGQQGGGFPGQQFFPRYDPDKQQASAAVLGALIAIAAFAVLWFHVRR